MALIHTSLGDIDERNLRITKGTIDNSQETVQWVEYCWLDCPGRAHHTGKADAHPFCFCAHHIHRSADVKLKLWPDGLIAGIFR